MLNSCESQVNALHIELALTLVHCTWTCPCHCKKSSNEKIITVSLHKSIRITSAFLRDQVVSISKEKYLLQDVSRVPSHRVINAIHIRLNCIFIAKYMAGINYLSRSEAAREDEMSRSSATPRDKSQIDNQKISQHEISHAYAVDTMPCNLRRWFLLFC